MATLTPERIQTLSDPVAGIYRELETRLLENIISTAFDGAEERAIDDSWRLEKLGQLPEVADNSLALLIEEVEEVPEDLRSALTTGTEEALETDADVYKKAIAAGVIIALLATAYGDPANVPEITARDIDNTYMRILAKLNLVNAQILNGCGVLYADTINRFTSNIVNNKLDYWSAVRNAVQSVVSEGLPGFIDRAGKVWSPEAYVSMVVRTEVNSVANRAQFARMDALGVDLLEVSSHNGARERCEPYQGRLFSRSGGSGTVLDLYGNAYEYGSWADTSYGEPAGLLGCNCGHTVYPFFAEYSTKTFDPTEDAVENARVYAESQKQRYYESQIRNAKTTQQLLDNIDDVVGAERAQQIIESYQQKLIDFLEETGRTRRPNREQIYA